VWVIPFKFPQHFLYRQKPEAFVQCDLRNENGNGNIR